MTPFTRDPDEMREIYMRKVQASLRRGGAVMVVVVVLALLLMVSLFKGYVPAGHVGVLTLFGKVTDRVLSEGTRPVWPWLVNHRLSVRTQELKETASVPSNEGLIVTLDTSLLFRLDERHAHEVFRTIGPNYIQVVIEPNLRSAIRSVTAAHSANALYTGERERVAQQIEDELKTELEKRGIVVESVLLRDVKLPQMLATAIEAKQQAEQEALRMNFVLQKEQQEAERKRIEAAEKLAQSSNAKVVVIGSGERGLPLILGGQ